MRLRNNLERHFLSLHLLIMCFVCARGIEVSQVTRNETFEETSLRNEFSAREGTTIAATATATATGTPNHEPISLEVVENHSRNDSDIFRPSVHLGEIEQPTIRTNPFNNVQDVKFENDVHLDTQHEHFQNILPNAYQGQITSVLDEATRSSRIKFQDDGVVQTSIHHLPLDDQHAITESPKSPLDETVEHAFVDQTFYQNTEKPAAAEAHPSLMTFGKPMTDYRPTGAHFDVSKSPYVVDYYINGHNVVHQPPQQDTAYEMTKKPENGVLLLQQHESTYTRKRKFPYQFYQSYHNAEYAEEPRHPVLVPVHPISKASHWKKIIHLIGVFLPLGLLLASLTPKIIRIDNTTQPNIILSKLRLVDLPAEHKQTRLLDDDQPAVCEDRSICELILAGSKPKSNILQNILWNLATRISDDVAKKNSLLRQVFNAVKKKDCTTIICQ